MCNIQNHAYVRTLFLFPLIMPCLFRDRYSTYCKNSALGLDYGRSSFLVFPLFSFCNTCYFLPCACLPVTVAGLTCFVHLLLYLKLRLLPGCLGNLGTKAAVTLVLVCTPALFRQQCNIPLPPPIASASLVVAALFSLCFLCLLAKINWTRSRGRS